MRSLQPENLRMKSNIAEFEKIFSRGCETNAVSMIPCWLVTVKGPEEDLDRIFDEIIRFEALVYGKTDRNAFRTPPGFEYYRPMQGTPTGAEDETAHPSTDVRDHHPGSDRQ